MKAKTLINAMGILQSVLILGGLMIVGLFLSSQVAFFISHGTPTRESVLWGAVAQNILAFILPAVTLPYFMGRRPKSWLNYEYHGRWTVFPGILLMMIAALPMMSIIIDLNAGVHFPDSLKGFEEVLRQMEDAGSESTKLILENSSVGQLIVSVLVVGIITGIGEEMFFRAGLQNLLCRFGVRPWCAIVIAAIIFSAAHFQFFGFVPRLMLGCWFGWLYWRYQSIVTSATAHVLNNTLVLISTLMIERGSLSVDFEFLGMPVDQPVIAFIASIGLCLLVFRFFFKPDRPVTEQVSDRAAAEQVSDRSAAEPKVQQLDGSHSDHDPTTGSGDLKQN